MGREEEGMRPTSRQRTGVSKWERSYSVPTLARHGAEESGGLNIYSKEAQKSTSF